MHHEPYFGEVMIVLAMIMIIWASLPQTYAFLMTIVLILYRIITPGGAGNKDPKQLIFQVCGSTTTGTTWKLDLMWIEDDLNFDESAI
jgi:hypothetical protein